MVDEQEDPYAGVKRLRKTLIVLLVIFCITAFAYSMINLNFLKKPLEESFGGHLKVHGDFKPGLDGFHPTVVVNNITYGTMKLERFEMRVPLAAPRPGKPLEMRATLTALTLPGRPPIDIDLLGHTDKTDGAIDSFTLSSGNSLITGTGSHRAGALDVKAVVKSLDYGLLYPGASGGAADGKLTLEGFGTSRQEITGSLSGRLQLSGGKGKIPGRALALWGGNMLAALLPNDATVNCAVAEFDMKNGVATATRVAVDTENLNITGTGTIDFNAMYMNMVFTPQPKTATTFNTVVPLAVSGVFGEVTATPNGSPVAPQPGTPSPCQQVNP